MVSEADEDVDDLLVTVMVNLQGLGNLSTGKLHVTPTSYLSLTDIPTILRRDSTPRAGSGVARGKQPMGLPCRTCLRNGEGWCQGGRPLGRQSVPAVP